jgi:hypothetical protein
MRNSYVMTNDARAAVLGLADLMRLGPPERTLDIARALFNARSM